MDIHAKREEVVLSQSQVFLFDKLADGTFFEVRSTFGIHFIWRGTKSKGILGNQVATKLGIWYIRLLVYIVMLRIGESSGPPLAGDGSVYWTVQKPPFRIASYHVGMGRLARRRADITKAVPSVTILPTRMSMKECD